MILSIPAIASAATANMVLGALWYSPLLFGNAWLNALGEKSSELSSPTPAMIGSAISCLVAAFSIAILIQAMDVHSAFGGMLVGAICGVGLVGTSMLSDSLFCGWGWKLFFIQSGYRIVYLVVMGGIVGGWPD